MSRWSCAGKWQVARRVLALWAGCAVAFGGISATSAEQLKYIDEAGNIRFVDRMVEVPKQYRSQVVPPTPTIFLDQKGRRELERRKREEQQLKERKAREKERELKKRQAELEKRQREEARKLRQQDKSGRVGRM